MSSGPEIPGLPGPPKPESDENGGLVVEAENHASKKIIQSEEEAKARLAEKRREMKEKKEREAELERQRQLEAERLEAERKVHKYIAVSFGLRTQLISWVYYPKEICTYSVKLVFS